LTAYAGTTAPREGVVLSTVGRLRYALSGEGVPAGEGNRLCAVPGCAAAAHM